jgi:uncharacterized protein (TIGR03435 family)
MMKQVILRLLASCILYGQTPDPSPNFEVASVKLSEPSRLFEGMLLGCSGGPGTDSPGQITCVHVEMPALLRLAFGLQPYQYKPTGRHDFSAPIVTGGYNISAKIAAGATPEDVRTMWQNLLVERFKLAYHFEKKDAVVYDLLIAKGGSKLKEAAPETDGVESPSGAAGSPATDANGCPILHPRYGTSLAAGVGRVACQTFSAATVEDIVNFVSRWLSGPVIDLTNLQGRYDFSIRFSRGETVIDDPTAPALLSALRRQLGLKIEEKRGVAEIFVVDHAEKIPSEN